MSSIKGVEKKQVYALAGIVLLLALGGVAFFFGFLMPYVIVLLVLALGGTLHYIGGVRERQVTVKDIEADEIVGKGKLEFEKAVEEARRFKLSKEQESAISSYNKAMKIYEWLVDKGLDDEDASLLFSRLGELKKEMEK